MLSPDVKPLGEEKANNTVTVHLLWNWLDILGCLEKPILILPPNVRSTRVYKGRIRYIGILMASVHQYKYIPKILFMQIIFYWDIYLPRISCHHSILGLRKYTMLSWLTESITKDIIPITVLEQFQTQNRIWSKKKKGCKWRNFQVAGMQPWSWQTETMNTIKGPCFQHRIELLSGETNPREKNPIRKPLM